MFLPGHDICSHLTPACTSQQEPPPSHAQTYTNRHMHHKPVHHTCRYRRTLICTHTFTVMRLPNHDPSYRCRTCSRVGGRAFLQGVGPLSVAVRGILNFRAKDSLLSSAHSQGLAGMMLLESTWRSLSSPDPMNFSSYLQSPRPSSGAQLLWYPLFPKGWTEALAVPCTTACV